MDTKPLPHKDKFNFNLNGSNLKRNIKKTVKCF